MSATSVGTTRFTRLSPWPRSAIVSALLVALIVFAAALRLEAAGDRPGRPSADERAYVRLAGDLRANGDYGGPTMAHPLHWSPGTPALFALADALTGRATTAHIDLRAARRTQAVVGTLTVAAAFALATLIGGAWAGLAAAAAVAVYCRWSPVSRVPEQLLPDAVAARHPKLGRDAAISAELHRNLRVDLPGRPGTFARMVGRSASPPRSMSRSWPRPVTPSGSCPHCSPPEPADGRS